MDVTGPDVFQATLTHHDDSETESEAEMGEVCQAERIAVLKDGHARSAPERQAVQVRKGSGLRLLPSDLPYSSKEELEQNGEACVFYTCNHHRALYMRIMPPKRNVS